MRRTIIGILTLAASLAVIVLIYLWLSSIENPVPSAAALQKIFILSPEDFRPEPREQAQYIACTLAFPILCAILYLFFTRLAMNWRGNLKYIHLSLTIFPVAAVFLLAFADLRAVNNNYLHASALIQRPILALMFCTILLVVFWLPRFKRAVRWPACSASPTSSLALAQFS